MSISIADLNTDEKSYILVTKASKFIKELITIKYPPMQTDISKSKIDSLMASYINNSHHFLSRCIITVAIKKIGHIEEKYLVDGQHRVEMMKNLLMSSTGTDLPFIVAYIRVKDDYELKKLFNDINSDSLKCSILDLTDFDARVYEYIKTRITSNFFFLPKITSIDNSIYTSSDFVKKLIDKNIIDFIKNKIAMSESQKNDDKYIAEQIYDYIVECDKKFFETVNYIQEKKNKPDKYKFDEDNSITNGSCMFIIANNFIDYIVNPLIEPTHIQKIKLNITADMRKKVWYNMYTRKQNGMTCCIDNCCNKFNKSIDTDWNIGFIKHPNNQLIKNHPNSIIVCTPCYNLICGNNFDKEQLENYHTKERIKNKYFNASDDIKCGIKNCLNTTNVSDFIIDKIPTKTGSKRKPICCYH